MVNLLFQDGLTLQFLHLLVVLDSFRIRGNARCRARQDRLQSVVIVEGRQTHFFFVAVDAIVVAL